MKQIVETVEEKNEVIPGVIFVAHIKSHVKGHGTKFYMENGRGGEKEIIHLYLNDIKRGVKRHRLKDKVLDEMARKGVPLLSFDDEKTLIDFVTGYRTKTSSDVVVYDQETVCNLTKENICDTLRNYIDKQDCADLTIDNWRSSYEEEEWDQKIWLKTSRQNEKNDRFFIPIPIFTSLFAENDVNPICDILIKEGILEKGGNGYRAQLPFRGENLYRPYFYCIKKYDLNLTGQFMDLMADTVIEELDGEVLSDEAANNSLENETQDEIEIKASARKAKG